jgi:predicted homoserine dehydrogenase-like protein
MVTSFADGSKVSFEQGIVANAAGFKVLKRGMSRGYEHRAHVDGLTKYYQGMLEEIRQVGGIVDYVVGATPGPGIYCIAEHPDPKQQHYLNLYKLGEGPLYSFYTPWHLCHFEVPNTVARVALFGDAAGVPLAGPSVEVCAVAKVDLKAGQTLDEYGGYLTYGEAVNAEEMLEQNYLHMGLVEGCVLRRDLPKDAVLTYADVKLPEGRLADKLLAEQYRHFFPSRVLT